MSEKKIIVIFIILMGLTANVFALDIASIAKSASTFYDLSFLSMITSFLKYRIVFEKIAKTIATLVCIIGAFWWVMKILLMGENTEKAIVDIITKAIIYIVLINVYFTVVDSAMSTGMSLGMARTVETLEFKFAQLVSNIEKQTNEAINVIRTSFTESEGVYKYTGISENGINELAVSFDLDAKFAETLKETIADMDVQVYKGYGIFRQKYNSVSEEVNKKTELYNQAKTVDFIINQINPIMAGINKASKINAENAVGSNSSLMINLDGELTLDPKYEKAVQNLLTLDEYIDAARENAKNEFYMGKEKNGVTIKDAVTRFEALLNVCTINDENTSKDDMKNYLQEHIATLKPIELGQVLKYNPYMSDPNGNLILSPAAILKTGALVASLCNSQTAASVNADVESDKTEKASVLPKWLRKTVKIVERKIQDFTYKHILTVVLDFLINLGVLLSAIYFSIQYIMMMLEYYLVTAIGFLFLPLIMWEITSSYAKNLIKLLASYFLKIMIMCICLGFAWSNFFELATILAMPSGKLYNDPWTMVTSVGFTLLISLAFVGEAPKMAQTLLTGSPEMSMGEFMKQTAAVVGATKLAGKGIKKAGSAAGKIAGLPVKGAVAGKMAANAHKEKKTEMDKAKGLQTKANGEVAAAKQEQTAAGAALASARGEQTAAQGHFDTADKNYNDAQEQVNASQAKYDEARKAAKGKHGNSKEAKAMKVAEKQLNDDRAKRDDTMKERTIAKDRLDEKNAAVQKAETEKRTADEKVRNAENFQRDANRHAAVVSRMPGARNMVGALAIYDAVDSKTVRSMSRFLGLPEGSEAVINYEKQREQYANSFMNKKQDGFNA